MEKKPIPLFLLLAALLTCAGTALAALRCANCGTTPVPYQLSTGPNLGHQAYKLRCAGGALWLDSMDKSFSYRITSINPQCQRLVIRPAALATGTCLADDFHSEGIQRDPNLPFKITSSNTILLLNCTDALLHLQAPINCSSTSICHAYVRGTPAAAACGQDRLCCMFRTGGSQTSYVIRVHRGGCSAYQSFVNLDPSLPVAKWPEPEVELEWALPAEPSCQSSLDCGELRNSRCLPDPASSVFSLFNNNRELSKLCLSSCRWFHTSPGPKWISKILSANNNGEKSARIFSGKEINKATNNFSRDNLLGSGGFGEVFRSILDNGTVTAVKRAKPGNTKGTVHVLNEVRVLCQVNHRSLVRLLGCRVELDQPLIIYEYIPNGTLFDHHRRNWPPLTWQQRLTIALQTAEGRAYLHSSAVPPIYHRDVKSSNILLDEKLDAKVSDFGLSHLVELSESSCSHIYTSSQGTLRYLDPEYYLNVQLTDRSDVYSFGVVLLELLTSKKAIDFNREEENVNLVVHVKMIMEEERLMEALDPVLMEGATEVELETMKALGYLVAECLDERRQNRPSMKEVVEEIECIISIVTGEASESTS
ncbi:Non-specific serine/threonine protein kinase [Bertholletia excelsa]